MYSMRRDFRYSHTILLCALLAPAAQAVDIDAIVVRSAVNEPLLADIPLDATEEELQDLRVALADPVVFARTGLPRPDGVVSALRFGVSRIDGRPSIQVTTDTPVHQEFFSFLIQLDWSAGRMIREFSIALRERPPAVIDLPSPAATAAPLVASPAAVHAPGVAPDDGASPADTPPIALASARPAVTTVAPAPVPPPAAPPARTGNQTPAPSQSVTQRPQAREHEASISVAAGDTLSAIADRTYAGQLSQAQTLAALFAHNQHAFLSGNMNLLRLGAELSAPPGDVVAAIPAAAAQRLVAAHAHGWRDGLRTDEMEAALAPVLAAAQPSVPVPAPALPARLEIDAHDALPADLPAPIALAGAAPAPGGSAPAIELAASQEAELDYLRSRVNELEAAGEDMRRVLAAQDQALARAQAELARAAEQPRPHGAWWFALAALLPLIAFALRRKRDADRMKHGTHSAARTPDWHRAGQQPTGSTK